MRDDDWSLVLLDHFHLLERGQDVAVSARKAVALLAYLAVQRDRSARRDVIAALLWEHSDPVQARISLRQAIAVVRRHQGDAAPILQTDGDYVRLAAHVAVDVDRFLALSTGDEAARRGAAEVYAGDFLDGFILRDGESFNDWLALTQAHYRQRAVAVLTSLIDDALAPGGDLNGGIAAALRLSSIDPFNEHAVRGLMSLYARQGRAGLGLSCYRQFADLVRRELQVLPEETTQDLFRTIAAQRKTREQPPVAAPAIAPTATRDQMADPVHDVCPHDDERAPASVPSIAAAPPVEPLDRPASSHSPRRRMFLGASLCAMLLIGLLAAGWVLLTPAVPAIARVRLIVGHDRAPNDVALAPAGDRLAFSGHSGDGSRLLLTSVASPDAISSVSAGPDDRYPAWTPDGRALAFVRTTAARSDVIVRTMATGRDRTVYSMAGRLTGLAWSLDGGTIFASASPRRDPWFRLGRLDVASGNWRLLANIGAGAFQDLRPMPSPDGTRLLFVRRAGAGEAKVYVYDLSRQRIAVVEGQRGHVFKAVWMPDGRSIVYGALADGESALWYLSLGRWAASPRRLTAGLDEYRDLSLSSAGDRLASVTSRELSTFWTAGARGSGGLRQLDGLLPGTGDRDPERTTDGRIAFMSARTGVEQVWVREIGGALRQLTHAPDLRYESPQWSPQGTVLAISAQARDGTTDLYLIDPGTRTMRRLTQRANAHLTSWSEDGRYLFYRGEDRASGMWQYDVLTGAVRKVLQQGYAGIPTPDGRGFIYVKGDLSRIWQRSRGRDGGVAGSESLLVDDLAGSATVAGNAIVYLGKDPSTGATTIRRYDFETRATSELARFPDPPETITLAPDGTGGVIFSRVVQQRQVSLLDLE